MIDHSRAVASGDGTDSSIVERTFVDDGMGGFWTPTQDRPIDPRVTAIMHARPPRRRMPLRAFGFPRRTTATRSSRKTTTRRTTRHASSTRSTASASAGSDKPGNLSGRPPRSPRVEHGHLKVPALVLKRVEA